MSRIASLETYANEFVCFVKVTADDGGVGWGQTSTYNADITATIFHRQVAHTAFFHSHQRLVHERMLRDFGQR